MVLTTMVILAEYRIECNDEEEKIFVIISLTVSYCPICGEALDYRDTCIRYLLREGRDKETYIIPRGKCDKCGKIHRMLPDIVVPYKQYAAEVISGVLDEVIQPEDEDSADYPCDVTMQRWHHWLMANELRIDGYLKSAGHRVLGFSEELLKTDVSLLKQLRNSCSAWLETVLRFIYNSGGFLVPG
ncbi:MAG: DUF6431 domain-containing protein [Lachnospiraceae bacterium]|nr:DUF6431 domain-containing protein [Lachnospiraceae bacterium]